MTSSVESSVAPCSVGSGKESVGPLGDGVAGVTIPASLSSANLIRDKRATTAVLVKKATFTLELRSRVPRIGVKA